MSEQTGPEMLTEEEAEFLMKAVELARSDTTSPRDYEGNYTHISQSRKIFEALGWEWGEDGRERAGRLYERLLNLGLIVKRRITTSDYTFYLTKEGFAWAGELDSDTIEPS